MDQTTQLLALIVAAALGILATLAILRRQRAPQERRARARTRRDRGHETLPDCGMGNLVTDATCSSCGRKLPG